MSRGRQSPPSNGISPAGSSRFFGWLWIFVAGCLVVWGLVYVGWPFGRDQGTFAWVGDVVLRGGLPYRDAWDVKGPAVYVVYAVTQWIAGRHQWAIRLVDLLSLAASGVAMWRLERWHTGARWPLSPLLFALCYAHLGFWHTAQPDGWAATLVLLSIWWLVAAQGQRRMLQVFAAGVPLGLAFLLKSPFGVFVVPAVVYTIVTGKERRFGLALSLGAGFAAPVVLILAWFAAAGAVSSLLENQVVFDLWVHALNRPSVSERALAVLSRFSAYWFLLVALPLFALGCARLWQRSGALAILVLGQLGAALFVLALQGKFYYYQALPLLALTVLLSGLGFSSAMAAARHPLGSIQAAKVSMLERHSAAVASILLLLGLIVPARQIVARAGVTLGKVTAEQYMSTFENANFSYRSNFLVVQYLRSHTREGDAVLVWGSEPLVYYLSGRPSPTRFGFNYPLTLGARNPFERAYRAEFLEALRRKIPVYIVVPERDEGSLTGFPDLVQFIERNYRRDTVIESFVLWRVVRGSPLH